MRVSQKDCLESCGQDYEGKKQGLVRGSRASNSWRPFISVDSKGHRRECVLEPERPEALGRAPLMGAVVLGGRIPVSNCIPAGRAASLACLPPSDFLLVAPLAKPKEKPEGEGAWWVPPPAFTSRAKSRMGMVGVESGRVQGVDAAQKPEPL